MLTPTDEYVVAAFDDVLRAFLLFGLDLMVFRHPSFFGLLSLGTPAFVFFFLIGAIGGSLLVPELSFSLNVCTWGGGGLEVFEQPR